jgi:hypothetical protein
VCLQDIEVIKDFQFRVPKPQLVSTIQKAISQNGINEACNLLVWKYVRIEIILF